MSEIFDKVADLSPAKRRLLWQRLSRQGILGEAGGGREPALVPVPRDGHLPLSFAQQRLWFLSRLAPESPAYNLPFALRVEGPLTPGPLRGALAEVVRRHEVLRTTFPFRDGSPVQEIAPALAPPLPLIDLSALPPADRDRETSRLAASEARAPFDLDRGPLLRATLLRWDTVDHVLLFTLHHMVSDGWSMGVLVKEVTGLYGGFAVDSPPSLPPLPVQYADFAAWQRRWLSGETLESQLSYWRTRLAGAPPTLELPTDRPRPPRQSFRGAAHVFALPPPVKEAAESLGRTRGTSLFAVLLAGFAALLQRYTGQDDILVGSPVANRHRLELEGLIGFFVNTLVMRFHLTAEPEVAAVVDNAREVVLEAQAHQDLPFDRLVEELVPDRSLQGMPLVQVMLALQNAPMHPLELPGLKLSPLPGDSGTAKLDLTLSLVEEGGGLSGRLEYATDLFDPATALRLAGHYRTLLAAMSQAPDLPLSELPLLGEAERHALWCEANDFATPLPAATVVELFEAQAARTPEALAVAQGGERLTYRRLERRANLLAHRLREAGVGPEVPVGISFQRSVDMVVAMTAVLKAGGAYVPLDRSYPEERLLAMLEDAGVKVLVSDRPEDPVAAGRLVLAVPAGESPAPPPALASPGNLAYVIFTSGSTGRPKGVAVPHASLLNLILWHRRIYGTGPAHRVSQVAASGFDAAVWEIWPTLAAGASLHLSPEEVRSAPASLPEWVAAEGITHGFLPTPMAEAVLDDPRLADSVLAVLLTGGDRLRRRPSARSPFRLVNHYGPTESTVVATWSPVAAEGPGGEPAIGRPIDNLEVHLLDSWSRLVPPGAAGEIWIGGAGLARGYLGRPDLTADLFRPHPLSGSGARLYRSGDLARRRPDGSLEFLGRIDHQVNIRGFRIELGEIEALLVRHPGVREAIAVAREGARGERRLVAYVLPAGTGGLDAGELSTFLRHRLPVYMVPAHVIAVERWPLTPNGKVDRAALPAPGAARGEEPEAAPLTPVEELLAGLWEELLGAGQVGQQDDFFALGGHSLLATQLVARVSASLGVELPLATLFEAPRLGELAERLAAAERPQTLPPLKRRSGGEPVPLSFAQQRLWFLDRLVPGNPFYNVYFALEIQGPLAVPALEESFREVVRRHESLRTTFRSVDNRAVQMISPVPSCPLPVVDLRGLDDRARRREAARLAGEQARRPFDLVRGPLIRTLLLRLDREEHALLLTLHHIVSDGWSLGVLYRELAALYEAFTSGRQSPLAELPVQYADFALWQSEWLRDEALERQLAYWRRQLAGAPAALELPFDHPRPAVESFRGDAVALVLPADLTAALKALSRRSESTLFMTLLAAFATLLHRHSGQDDVLLGSPIANRTQRELEGLIGFFVNTLVLRSDLSGDPGFLTLLARVRRMALAAYAHQDLPFEKLVEELGVERSLGRNPLCQALFALQNFPLPDRRMGELRFAPLSGAGLGSGTSKFDLTLFLRETGGELRALLEINLDLFERATARRLLERFVHLLRGIVEAPDLPLSELPLLSEAERHAIVHEANDVSVPFPASTVAELFAAQAAATPEAIALAGEEGVLTYRELDERANRLASHLVSLGAGPETIVAVGLERSLELIVAIVGTVKSGAAYLPVDPGYPVKRLHLLLADAGARLLVTVDRLAERFAGAVSRVVRLDGEAGEIAAASAASPRVSRLPASLLYVMYTSGSTGRPKGVCVTHGSVVRLVRGASYAELGPQEVFLQMAPASFDASTLEIWGALLNGGRLAVMPAQAPSLEELGAALERYGVRTLWLTAGLFHQMVDHNLTGLRGVRQLLAGGDALSVLHVRRVLQELPGTRLINGYGPTENTTFTCCHGLSGAEPVGASVPIGRPISNTRVYLLDREGRPVPWGVAGELCAGGAGLARGYLGKPDLTAERFVPHPFGEPGERLYRTGDLARWLPDGTLEFLGRIDHQVKLRGFRIELGEIEAVLTAHPAVESCVVLAREDNPGQRQLVAYVVQSRETPEIPQEAAGSSSEHVTEWQLLYEDTYGQGRSAEDAAFNIVGWNSSYTGESIPAGEMREWVDHTVGEILDLSPGRVLEIGCGTGLLLQRIAPHCTLYHGTDFSRAVLGWLGERISGSLPQVTLEQRLADDFSGLAPRSFDAVVLSSVVQYFPSIDYLVQVLGGAVETVADGGFVFLGDVRSLPVLEAFHASVELHRASPALPARQLRQAVETQRRQENELVVDPAFFIALQRRAPRISWVEIRPKRGRADNELTRFRYQVILYVGPAPAAVADPVWLDWQREGLTLEALRRRLANERPADLGVLRVPSSRLTGAVAAASLLAEEDGPATAGEIRERLGEAAASGCAPDDLWELGRELGYAVDLGWSHPGAAGSFEARFRRPGVPRAFAAPGPPPPDGPWSRFANNPLLGRFARRIVPELRGYLEENLPGYMAPSAFVLLDRLPLTANGKVDRRALPAPEVVRPDLPVEYAAPRTVLEEELARIWSQVLNLDRIGIHDDFFALGGHSLLATQVVSRIRNAFGVELPLSSMFASPTVAELVGEIEALRAGGAALPLRLVPRDADLPLSFAQERLWFLDQFEGQAPTYNVPGLIRIRGRLDVPVLAATFAEIVRRHEALRTTFSLREGRPVQVVAPRLVLPLPVVSFEGLPETCRERELARLADREARRLFDLAGGPLLRTALLRLESEDHLLLLTMHHIVSDGWSVGVLFNELAALYRAFLRREPSPLSALPIQYADFAVWQRTWLRGEMLEAQVRYWKERLRGIPDDLGLPTDRPHPPVQSYHGRTLPVRIPSQLAAALQDLGRGDRNTLFMILLAVFQTLLHRYTGAEDLVVGSPIANRNRFEVEGLIGFFVNTLALRTDASGDPTFRDLLARVSAVTLEAYDHQDLPFERLVEELQPQRCLGRHPIFQVMFQLQNAPMPEVEIPGLSLRLVVLDSGTAKFDLSLFLRDTPQGLAGILEYATDLFDATTALRLASHYQELLAAVVADPEQRLSELPLLAAAERQQLRIEWAGGRAPYPSGAVIPELFAAVAASSPSAVALVCGEETLTYAELGRRARNLARELRRLGVGPEVLVGICAERSAGLIVGLLAILEAGGAYLPLDPEYPEERLRFMLADTGVRVLLAQRSAAAKLPRHRATVIDLDGEARPDLPAAAPVPHGAGPESLAYVMYTSGSTGQPKGVGIPHRGVVRLAKESGFARFGPDEVFLQAAPVSFDAATLEIWACLLNGGRLVLPPPGVLALERLGGVLREHGVTTLWLTAGLFHLMVDERLADLAGVRQLLAGGDVLSVPHVGRALAGLPGCALINGYGPTENTTFTCCHPVARTARAGSVPIGRPINATRIYVLGRRFELLPAGVAGELLAGGDGLARGYLHRPDLTAERFVPDPHGGEPGARLYRTGDLCRYLADGTVEFLGRIDQQVKIRGFRVEPGEVEAALRQHPGVREAAVVVRPDGTGQKRLVAYVETAGGTPPTAADLGHFLKQRLPEPMVPGAYIALDSLPLTAHGKVDRRALPAPERERPSIGGAPPATPVEELMAGIWEQVLGVERVGRDDGFFDLGGHSLLATQVASRIRQVFGVEVSLRSLFEMPTLSGHAGVVESALRGGGERQAPPIPRVSHRQSAPLSFAQQRLWLIDQLEPESPLYNVPVVLRLTGRLDTAALARSFGEIIRRHEVLRTVFSSEQGQPVQRVSAVCALALARVDLGGVPSARRGSEALRLAAREIQRPFDLRKGPLLRVLLVQLGDAEHLLALTMHHIVSDGWSMGVLVKEMAALYAAFCVGLSSPLPELPIQYADFAHWQREWLQAAVLEPQLAFWRQCLRGAPPLLEVPADRPRPAVRSGTGAAVPLRLPSALSARLRELSRSRGCSLFMTLLAAFQALLARYTGRTDIVVGTPIANRTRVEVEGLIGFFVNTLVLRTDVAGNPPFSELLGRVREMALAAHAHQDLPFERLVEELQPERSLGHTPLFQVAFVLQNAPMGDMQAEGLSFDLVAVADETAKFDLSLELLEADGAVAGRLAYSTDMFDAATAGRMVRHFETLLSAALREPEAPLSRLPLLTAVEGQQVLQEWSGRPLTSVTATIPELFAAQAERTPDNVAAVFGSARLTYRELDRQAGSLAQCLRARGVGPESLVGLRAERSPELLVGMLAILKAGGAYVPLDAAQPRERLAMMLADAGVELVLADTLLAADLPVTTQVLPLAMDLEDAAAEQSGPPAAQAGPDNLAYVMFTSGSTGRPKGVRVTHRAVVRLVCGADYARLGPKEVFLQLAPVSFDASTLEIWGCLLNGGRLAIMPPGVPSLEELGRALAEHQVTTLWLTAGLFHLMVDQRLEDLRPVCQLLAGGDVLSPSHVNRLLRQLPDIRLINGYGPTENTTFTCCHAMAGGAEISGRVPIGRPIQGTRIYILDQHLEPVPAGVPGELYAGGHGLARDYCNQPVLTAERLAPNPFADQPGERLYKTGDLARFLPDGNVEFLGRVDRQVKIRGFRVEPDEIEVVLGEHPAVREAAIVVSRGIPGEERLVAYVVLRHGEEASAQSLRDDLRRRLPEPMVPASFVFLAELPLTPNGKLDRQSLPLAEEEISRGLPAVPGTATAEILAGIWTEILGVTGVGPDDNFFELGGHSLLAARVASRLREVLGVELPLRHLFEAPTLADLALAVEAARTAGRSPLPPITPVPRSGALPLSFAQQRLWLVDRLAPGNPAYNIANAVRLEGRLDVPALHGSLAEIVRRHEALRTTFGEVAGEPVEVVAAPGPFPLPLVDLGGLPAPRREAELRRLTLADARRPFDLARGPLLRATLVHLEDPAYAVLFAMHHIVGDGWSMGVLLRELSALYSAASSGRPSPLQELSVQYPDFAVWQRAWLQGEILEAQLSYWRSQLAGLPAELGLPKDRPRPASPSYRGAHLPLALEPEVAAGLAALGQRQGATLFMILLAAFQALLSRWSGEEQVAAGSPVANRGQAETAGLIGFFVNTLVLRGDLAGDPAFAEVLARARETALGAYAHQDLPFERLVEALRPERDLRYHPLFQVMLSLQDSLAPDLTLPGLAVSGLPLETGVTQLDLSVSFSRGPEGVTGYLEYDVDLFDPSTAVRLARSFLRLLAACAAAPEQRIGALPLLFPGELHQVIHEWNDTDTGGFAGICLHELFEAQVERRPHGLALQAGEHRLTYRQLEDRANQLARLLLAAGVGPEDVVGLFLDRSPEMILGVLAVLKAGAAYVPLDPAYPQERLAYILRDSGARVVLTAKRLAGALHADGAVIVLADGGEAERQSVARPFRRADSSGLAYIIYTSGSTGAPKGVAITHQSAASYCGHAAAGYGISTADRVLQFSSLSFDASVEEIHCCLAGGATLVLRDEAMLASPAVFLRAIDELEISVLGLPTAFWHELASAGEPLEQPRRLRLVILGGEAALPDLRARWQLGVGRGIRLVNSYGPTEATIVATAASLGGETRAESQWEPIGRPLPNIQTYVLDRGGRPVPLGGAGELCIGGVGLARGYLRQPGLTADKLVPDPFSGRPGARLYRTGDLVRCGRDGQLQFLGRTDRQVKLRGFRIELGEIEAALVSHPAVSEAAVLARAGHSGDRSLVGYAACEPGRAAGPAELKAYLRQRLPHYMVPPVLVLLDKLPRSVAGKVDRGALPSPSSEGEAVMAQPRTPLEEVLAEIWAAVLDRDQVGVHDRFFDLGGHSLLATRLISRARAALSVEVPLRVLFERPTVAELAEWIANEAAGGARLRRPPIERFPRGGPLPQSFAQQRLWFLAQLQPESSAYNMPFGFRLHGRLDLRAFERAFAEIVRRHEVLRTSLGEVAGEPVAIVHPPQPFHLCRVDLGDLPEGHRAVQLQQLAAAVAHRPFDLGAGPLWRAVLVRLGEEEHAALLVLHHAIGDDLSTGVMVREVTALYQELTAGRPSPLPELPVQYTDFARWQRQWLRGEVLAEQLGYWARQLAGPLPLLDLPVDFHAPPASLHGAAESLSLPPSLATALRAVARREGCTLTMVLLSAFQLLLSRLSGQQDVIVGMPVANREAVELEGLIGLFLNTLALRTDLAGNPRFRDLLLKVRETTLTAYAHQDLPFEKLVEELQPERSLERHPIFEVLYNHLDPGQQDLALPGLSLTPLAGQAIEAKLPMTLHVTEQQGGIRLQIVYQAARFSAARMAILLRQLQSLLEQIAAAPDRAVDEFSLILPGPPAFLPDPRAPLAEPLHEPVTATFAAWAERVPEEPAVLWEGRAWSYAELAARSDGIARALLAGGLEPGGVVGVTGLKSFGLIASMIGVLASGGVLLALDRGLPPERRRLMLHRAGVVRLLHAVDDAAEAGEAEGLPASAVLRVAADTGYLVDPSPGPAERRTRPLDPDQSAYLVFTSGSTGMPKGILGCHKGLSQFLAWQREEFGVGPGDRCAQLTMLSFDAALRDIFLPLTSGACLCLPPRQAQGLEADWVLPWLDRCRVSLLHTVPTVAQSWLAGLPSGVSLRALRWTFFVGEPLSDALVRRWREAFPEAGGIVNLYGPTETTLVRCFFVVPEECPAGLQPAGRPIPQTQALVMAERSRLCGVGEPGEIHLRTPFRTLGYLDAREEAGRGFFVNPFRDDPRDLLYGTGDLGRYRPDGSLDVLGRLDFQIKVRGVRVEPDEVTAVLAGHPAVRAGVVIGARGERENRLIAYVVAPEPDRPGPAELRAFLAEQLPAAMIPAVFVFLDELPRTANGKVDRARLPEPDLLAAEEVRVTRAQTPIQEIVAAIWEEVLELPGIGPETSFFEAGGHSLLAAQVVSRLRQVFQVDLPLRDLFEEPTVEGLAKRVEAAMVAGRGARPLELRRVPRAGALPLSFAQQRQWFVAQLDSNPSLHMLPRALHLKGRLDLAVLQAALCEIVRRHESLRTTFPTVEGLPVQAVSPAASVGLPVVDLSGLPGAAGRQLALGLVAADARRPFDLACGPLLRVTVLRLGEEEHVALLALHHIIADEWSLGVLVREISLLYGALLQGEASPLRELPIQYADFAAWQRAWLSGEVLEHQLAFWRERLTGAPPALELPTDHPREEHRRFRGARRSFLLSERLTEAIKRLSRREGATLFMTLLAGFQALLYRLTSEEDLVVGAPTAGRNRAELEGLIGYFVNPLALRTDLSGNPTFVALLGRVRRMVLNAYAHQDVPFEKLVEELAPKRRLGRAPLFQVVFNFYNGPSPDLELPGLCVEPFGAPNENAKYDLTLYMGEQGRRLAGSLVYDADLFEQETIATLERQFEAVLESVSSEPELHLRKIRILTETEEKERAMKKLEQQDLSLKKLIATKRRTVSAEGAVRTSALPNGKKLPLVVEPASGDVDFVAWAGKSLGFIEEKLLEHGGILFRGFGLRSLADFDRATATLCPERVNYFEGSSPRVVLGDNVYTSTEYPPELFVSLHNELSYAHKWPRKILFFCAVEPQVGGETPIADSREIFAQIDPAVRERFLEKGVRYMRNLHGSRGAGLSWQTVFETADRAAVESYCREGAIEHRWREDGGLWTSQDRPAAVRHPQTGEWLWFNQVHQFHPSNLGEEAAQVLLAVSGESGLPINASYADGAPLEPAALQEVRNAYDRAMVRFPWREGDLLLLDNMLAAHGRMPFSGPRRIAVAMGETVRLEDVVRAQGK
jgi:amino acid adenylation domain-containing protein